MRAVRSPRRARTVRAVPAQASSRPAPHSRRARNQGARLTLRHRASSMACSFVRGPRPLARRTSSWWTKNSFRLGSRRTQPMRNTPGGGPDRSVATSQVKSRSASARLRRSARRPHAPRSTSPFPAIGRARAGRDARPDRASSTAPGESVPQDRVRRAGRRAVLARRRRRMDRLWPQFSACCGTDDSGFEPVAAARFGEQVPGPRRFGFELAAQLGQVNPQVVALRLVRGAPDLPQQLPLGDQAAAVADQDLEQLPFGRGQPDVTAVARMTSFAARSTVKSAVATTGSSGAGDARRTAARSRASSSSMPNGLVT